MGWSKTVRDALSTVWVAAGFRVTQNPEEALLQRAGPNTVCVVESGYAEVLGPTFGGSTQTLTLQVVLSTVRASGTVNGPDALDTTRATLLDAIPSLATLQAVNYQIDYLEIEDGNPLATLPVFAFTLTLTRVRAPGQSR